MRLLHIAAKSFCGDGDCAASFYAHVFFDKEYHVEGSRRQRFAWFRRKQELHFVHHRHANYNFAVIHFFWDRLLGAYRRPEARYCGSVASRGFPPLLALEVEASLRPPWSADRAPAVDPGNERCQPAVGLSVVR
jgi:hypothetical protein